MPALVGLPRNHSAEPSKAGRAVIIGIRRLPRPEPDEGRSAVVLALAARHVHLAVLGAFAKAGRAHGCGARAGHKFPGQQGGRRSARLPAGQLGPAGSLTVSRAGWLVGYLRRPMTVTFHAGCTSAQLAMCRPG